MVNETVVIPCLYHIASVKVDRLVGAARRGRRAWLPEGCGKRAGSRRGQVTLAAATAPARDEPDGATTAGGRGAPPVAVLSPEMSTARVPPSADGGGTSLGAALGAAGVAASIDGPLPVADAIVAATVAWMGFVAVARDELGGVSDISQPRLGEEVTLGRDTHLEARRERNPAQDRKLSNREARRIAERFGESVEDFKRSFGCEPPLRCDLYTDRDGNAYVKPKGGRGPGEETGVNIDDS